MTDARLTPHDWQEVDIENLLFWDCSGLVAVETGGGKSLTAIESVHRAGHAHNGAVLVIAPKSTFSDAWIRTVKRQTGADMRVINSKKAGKEAEADMRANVPGWYLINHELFTRRRWENIQPEVCVVDECFVAGTRISTPRGQVPVENIRKGDTVWGYDHESGRVVEVPVTNIMRRAKAEIVSDFGATPNHPYYVDGEGYYPIGDVTEDDYGYYLREAVPGQENLSVVRRPIRGHVEEPTSGVLREVVRAKAQGSAQAGTEGSETGRSEGLDGNAGVQGDSIEKHEEQLAFAGVSRTSRGAYDHEKSRQRPGDSRADAGYQDRTRSDVLTPERGERSRGASGSSHVGSSGWGMGLLILNSHKDGSRDRVSNLLQGGFGATLREVGGRMRRAFSQWAKRSRTGRKEGFVPSRIGLDRLAIREPRDFERYSGVRAASRVGREVPVYNIETSSHNYFAGGYLVHNCHKLSNWRLWFRKSSGAHRLIFFRAKRRIAMSATPYRNNFANLWTVLRWVYPETTESSPRKWIAKYCVTEPDFFAGEVVKGEKEPGRAVSEIPCYIYHAKRQRCCKFHPTGFLATEEPETEIRTVEMTGEQKKAYKSMEENYIAWLGENPHVVELPIVARSRLRQISLGMIQYEEDGTIGYAPDCESPKFDELVNVLKELGDEPVLVLTHSKKFAAVVADRLNGIGVASKAWTGDVKMVDREKIEQDFASGTIRVIVGVIAAMGTGVSSLARVTSTCVWLSESDDPSDNEQSLGRLDRLDSIGRVSNIHIQAEGTYDQGVMSKSLQYAIEKNASLARKVGSGG